MARWTAFSLLVTAAFGWSLPWLDRAGVALLGAAFLALAVGRAYAGAQPAAFRPRWRRGNEPMPEVEDATRTLLDRVAEYSGTDGASD